MLRWNEYSLRKQFLLLFVFIQILALIGLSLYFIYNERNFYLDQLEDNLVHQGKLIINNQKLDIINRKPEDLDNWIKELGRIINKRITVIDKYGLVLADSAHDPDKMDNHLNRPEVQDILSNYSQGLSIRRSNTLKISMFYLALPIERKGEIIGFLRLSESLNNINSIIRSNIYNTILFLILVSIIILLLLWRFSKDIINPVTQITRLARSFARGNFNERIRIKNYKNEINTLSRAFNFMAAQLEAKIGQISEEKNRAEAILKSMVDGLVAIDSNMQIRVINPAARKIFSLANANVKGKKVIEAFRHHEIDQFLENSLRGNTVLKKEIILQKEEKRIIRCYFAPVTNEEDIVIGGIIVFNDITELRKLEQLKTEFVGNVSHELRTPLTSIIGYVDTILENEIEDINTLKRFLNIIKTEADRLFILINDLLDLSRLENKGNQNILLPGNLQNIIDKTSLMLLDRAEEKNIELVKEVESDLPLVKMISEQIEQVLINLIDNSIKYTPEGGKVNIRAYVKDEQVLVEVEDNGIGIPAEEQERIFERFYRVDKARSRSLGGTGIGLSIVKHIIQNHHSEIKVESKVGQGSLFRFCLEIASF